MAWETIVLQPLEGEKRLFKIGLMTFKASSTKTDGQFAFIETEIPPGSKVERHHHPEAEMFYILSGTFDFWIDDAAEAIACGSGAFLCIPPDVPHSFANSGDQAGRIFGMLAPCRPEGLESFFRAMSIPVNDRADIPDLNQTVEHVQQIIAERRATGAFQS